MTMKTNVSVNEATHVKVGGKFVRIKSKYGVRSNGGLAKPSEGGFGVVTEDGRTVDMWHAQAYGKEEETP